MTHYEVLGVGRDATQDEIKHAYRKQAMRWHPDKNTNKAEAEDRFKQIATANQVLSKPDSKQEYDRRLETGVEEEPSTSFSYQQAFYMFVQEMLQLAYELTMQNIPHNKIAQELISRGCPSNLAYEIAGKVEGERKTAMRSSGGKLILRSVLMFGGGVLITALFYSMGWIVGVGIVLMISGVVNFIRALYFTATGRAPRQDR